MSSDSTGAVVGIDLGTTNSEVAGFAGGRVRVLGRGARKILPSCVGLSPSGELLVGEPARNQYVLHPERTIRSIKRRMGNEESVQLGDRALRPPEVSALILGELMTWARHHLGPDLQRVVITVPAYFSDAQRQATREAGLIAGLDVVRILNEPTAASLAYGSEGDQGRTLMVYDLGGGTFDVSIVTTEKDVTEVLASHGDNHLGGDDFDQLVLDHLLREFNRIHGIDLSSGEKLAVARLSWAAEQAKIRLSSEPYTVVREEALVTAGSKTLDFELEISRDRYEEMILPLVEKTLASVSRALTDAGKSASDIDDILLVGGASRTPLVGQLLERRFGLHPRQEVDPDLCVALGAGVLASRLAGHQVDRVLVDITPYSFGPSHLGRVDGELYEHCYTPIIRRNTPLPTSATKRYFTAVAFQEAVHIQVYQGDDPDALKNVPVGDFRIEGLTPVEEPNEVLCRMALDLDGILRVTAIEKSTGLSKHVTMEGALRARTPEEIQAARDRLGALFSSSRPDDDPELETATADDSAGTGDAIDVSGSGDEPGEAEDDRAWEVEVERARGVLTRSRGLLDRIHEEDREEAIDLHETIEAAITARDPVALETGRKALEELLFFVEGR